LMLMENKKLPLLGNKKLLLMESLMRWSSNNVKPVARKEWLTLQKSNFKSNITIYFPSVFLCISYWNCVSVETEMAWNIHSCFRYAEVVFP
jgi:hypothetical protein